jgi:hypothetical protein
MTMVLCTLSFNEMALQFYRLVEGAAVELAMRRCTNSTAFAVLTLGGGLRVIKILRGALGFRATGGFTDFGRGAGP